MYKKGDFVEMDGILGVVVATSKNENVPENHVGVWFGAPQIKRISEGGKGGAIPEVWTVPEDICEHVEKVKYCH